MRLAALRPGRATLAALALACAAAVAALYLWGQVTRAAPGGPLIVQRFALWPDLHYEVRHRGARPLTVQVLAAEHSWVRVELDGRPACEGTLEPGGVRTWNARRTLTAHLGNPRGLRVALQDEPLPLDWDGPIRLRVDG